MLMPSAMASGIKEATTIQLKLHTSAVLRDMVHAQQAQNKVCVTRKSAQGDAGSRKGGRASEWVEYACYHGQISRLMSSVVPSLFLPHDDCTHWWAPWRKTSCATAWSDCIVGLGLGRASKCWKEEVRKIKKKIELCCSLLGRVWPFFSPNHHCWPLLILRSYPAFEKGGDMALQMTTGSTEFKWTYFFFPRANTECNLHPGHTMPSRWLLIFSLTIDRWQSKTHAINVTLFGQIASFHRS